MSDSYEIAVLIPCHHPSPEIADVVTGFRGALPTARIYVYESKSDDNTAMRASLAGATVVRERRRGKGNIVRRMFADIEADIYVMADSNGTDMPGDAEKLVTTLIATRADMVVGAHRDITRGAGHYRRAFGSMVLNRLYRSILGRDFTDIFSGYRVFSRRFVKSFPAISNGFAIETEMSVHAWRLKLPVCEIELDDYRPREGVSVKLPILRGINTPWMLAMLMKETRPFAFYLSISSALLAASLTLMTPVVIDYLQTGLVPRVPTRVLSMVLQMVSAMAFTAGLILDSLGRSRTEMLRIHYLDQPALSATRDMTGTTPIFGQPEKPAKTVGRKNRAA